MYQLPKEVMERVANCDQESVQLLLTTIYDKFDKSVHVQKDILDIRYSQGVCYIVGELIKLTQPDRK